MVVRVVVIVPMSLDVAVVVVSWMVWSVMASQTVLFATMISMNCGSYCVTFVIAVVD